MTIYFYDCGYEIIIILNRRRRFEPETSEKAARLTQYYITSATDRDVIFLSYVRRRL